MGCDTFEPLFRRSSLHNLNGSRGELLDPDHCCGYQWTVTTRIEAIPIWVRHRWPRWNITSGRRGAVTAQRKRRVQEALDDDVSFLTTYQKLFARARRTEITDFKPLERLEASFSRFIAGDCVLAGITSRENVWILMLAELIPVQHTDADGQSTFESVGKTNTCFDTDNDRLMFLVCQSDGAPQRVIPASLRPRLLHICHYSLFLSHPVERRLYDSMRKSCTCLICPMRSMLLWVTVSPAHRAIRTVNDDES